MLRIGRRCFVTWLPKYARYWGRFKYGHEYGNAGFGFWYFDVLIVIEEGKHP